MDNLEFYNKGREVPEEAKKTIGGGRLKGMTDINPMWRIKKLTEMFGPCGIGWYYRTIRKWTETAGDETAAFVDIEMYIKNGEDWSMPICGTGGSMMASKEKSGVHVSDECYKMATTDAISVACKQLGIGADVYWNADRTKYDLPEGQLVTKDMVEKLKNEVDRIGWNVPELLKWLKVDALEKISVDKYTFAMDRMGKKPDKVPPPSPNPTPDIPDDMELPWS